MWRVVVGVLAVTAAAVGLWHPARVAVQTLFLLPAVFPSAPFDPLTSLTASPTVTQETYSYAAGTVDTEVFVPAGNAPHPAVMLLLGAGDLPRSDVAVQFATALARLGVLVALPESSGMLAEHLTFDEVDAIRVSLGAIDARTDVDAARVGIVGLSASGALSIVAASQSDMRDRIRFVNSFGSYDDAQVLLVDVASRSTVVEGAEREWTPEQRTVEVVANALADAGANEPDRAELVGGTSRERAQEIVNGFSPQVRERLEAVSPSSVLTEVRAHLYLMHDVDDPFIPFTESRMLVKQAPPGLVTRYTEFSIFEHVIPDRSVPWQTFLPDLWRLFWHVHAVLLELL
jgi:poly(3-hydroxybutyrate) depolymerase